MALRDEFESVRASILHESPLPTVDAAMTKLLTEETRNGISPDINSVFAAPRSYNTFQKGNLDIPQRDLTQIQCRYCKEYGHKVSFCPHTNSCYMRQKKGSTTTISSTAASVPYDGRNITAQSTTPTAADIQEMIHQALNMKNNVGNNPKVASAFSVPSDGSPVIASHIGYITITDALSLPDDHLTKKQIGTGRRVGRLNAVDKLHIPCSPITSLFAAPTPTCTPFMSWHSRLGHISFSRLRYMFNKRLLDQSTIDKEPCCVTCRLAKQPALPFNNSATSSSAPFDLVHSDIWGKAPISSMGGALYYVLFVDDYSRYTWIYLLRSRSDFLKIYIEFSTMIQTQFSKTIKVFRSDSGGE
ncbi:unnamed protein product [Prunus armeniaca]|uniref:Integrase catalytic domain-containing protein n=1 Tax=Prunus armeniaca TaxID=36596 RepID=A0A6J5WCP4_PRUAR|nr:unnamed protein product [Prunus armeniaca]